VASHILPRTISGPDAGHRLPPWRTVQGALRNTTEALSHELAQPTGCAPDWSEFEWRVARAVAAIHGVSPLLATRLRWQGRPGWAAFLQDQRNQTARRHSRTANLLQLLDECARARGIPAVALKGAELHSRGLYAPGDRPMADVDLLVRSSDSQVAAHMLQSLGFRAIFATSRERTFVQGAVAIPSGLGEQADNPLKIELHEHIREPLLLTAVDVTERIFPREPRPGLNPYPSTASLMTHLLLHAAGAMAFRALRLLHLHDIALLSARMVDQSWQEVLYQHDRAPWWALPPLRLTARYYPSTIPARVLSTLEADCPRVLRAFASSWTLSDVSLSRLRIDAFPGIGWAQSLPEMARYVAGRIWPDANLFALREHLGRTHPAVISSPWHHLSQGKRLLRWMLGRAPRDYTLYAVRMALEAEA
jgi:hypothetical protein